MKTEKELNPLQATKKNFIKNPLDSVFFENLNLKFLNYLLNTCTGTVNKSVQLSPTQFASIYNLKDLLQRETNEITRITANTHTHFVWAFDEHEQTDGRKRWIRVSRGAGESKPPSHLRNQQF